MTPTRRMTGARLVVSSLLAVAAGLILCSPGEAQAPTKGVVPFEGSHAFRHLLNLLQLKPVQKVSDLGQLQPRDTILIVFGDNRVLDDVTDVTGGLHNFRQQGGAILVASDRADDGRLRELGVSVTGHEVRPGGFVRDFGIDSTAYRGEVSCPLVKLPPFDYRLPILPVPEVAIVGHLLNSGLREMSHPSFRGLKQGIATNQPSSILRYQECNLRVLASFPPEYESAFSGMLRGRGRMRFGEFKREWENFPALLSEPGAFAYGTAASAGDKDRVLILGGHGVFINGMMGQRDNDNYRFAENCLRWLSDNGKRKHALFIEEGKVVTDFNVPLAEFPMPPLQVINELLHGLEKENFFNRLLLDIVPADQLLRIIFVILSIGLALYALRRLARARHWIEPTLPRITAKLARKTPELPILTQRQRALVEAGNFWEAACDLARHCFESDGHRPAHPPLAVEGGKHQRAALQRHVHLLWQLAYVQPPQPISVDRFAQLVALMETVHAALADGTLAYREATTKAVLQPMSV